MGFLGDPRGPGDDGGGRHIRPRRHAGHLPYIALGNFNGKDVVYVGGISNARHAATLIALDDEHWRGAAAEDNPEYEFQGMPRARERARILFPRSCINRRFEAYNSVTGITVQRNGLTVSVAERMGAPFGAAFDPIIYTLTNDLHAREVHASSDFYARHASMATTLGHKFSTAEEAASRQGLQYLTW